MRETPLARAQALGLVRSRRFDRCMAWWILQYCVYPLTGCSKAEPGTKTMHQTAHSLAIVKPLPAIWPRKQPPPKIDRLR